MNIVVQKTVSMTNNKPNIVLVSSYLSCENSKHIPASGDNKKEGMIKVCSACCSVIIPELINNSAIKIPETCIVKSVPVITDQIFLLALILILLVVLIIVSPWICI
jgi:hypothetical protein